MGAQVFDETGHWIDRSKCIHCFKCCEECYADALVSVGEWRDTYSILKEILENKGYFDQSKGGVTFSGGECMLQPDADGAVKGLSGGRRTHRGGYCRKCPVGIL